MATKKKLSAVDGDVVAVWIAPETLRAAALERAVADGKTPQEIADLAQAPMQGEYRESLGEEVVGTAITAKLGDRLVWVHPEGEDGWFEHYTGDEADYVPTVVTTAEEA